MKTSTAEGLRTLIPSRNLNCHASSHIISTVHSKAMLIKVQPCYKFEKSGSSRTAHNTKPSQKKLFESYSYVAESNHHSHISIISAEENRDQSTAATTSTVPHSYSLWPSMPAQQNPHYPTPCHLVYSSGGKKKKLTISQQ